MINRRPLAWLFVLIAVCYLLTFRGVGVIGFVVDEAAMLSVTAQLVDHGTLRVDPMTAALNEWGLPPPPPNMPYYSKYAIGQSLVAMPLYALGGLFNRTIPKNSPNGFPFVPLIPAAFVILTGTLTTLLAAYGVFRVARLMGASERGAAWLVILYAMGTLAWPYAKTFYNEPSTACAFIWLAFFAIRYRRAQSPLDGLLTGACLGAAILLRATSLVLIVPLLLMAIPFNWKRVWRVPWTLRWIVPGLAFGILVTLAYNAVRYGAITESGYESGFGHAPWLPLLGYVFSPSRSVFIFNPILMLSVPGAWVLWRTRQTMRPDTALLIGLILVPTVLYATWWAWEGGGALGARFLVPAIPLAVVLCTPFVDRLGWRRALIASGVTGFGVQVLCNRVTPTKVFEEAFLNRGLTDAVFNWQPDRSYLPVLIQIAPGQTLDSNVFTLFNQYLHNGLAETVLFIAVTGGLTLGMVYCAGQLSNGLPSWNLR